MQFRLILSLGLLLLMTSGCLFHGYPNGTYGSSPYVVPAQPSGGYPSGPVYQPGGTYTAPMNGAPYVPGTSPGTPTPTPLYPPSNSSPTPTYESQPGTNGNAPTFNPETPNGGKAVPLPEEDPAFERGTNRPSLTPTSHVDPAGDITPFSQQESRRRPQPYVESTADSSEQDIQFEEPEVRQTSSADEENAGVHFANDSRETSRRTAGEHGHHPEFRWVQGAVDYDESTKEWIIIYDKNPLATDQLGGVLTLADGPVLDRLRTGDLIRGEGSLDTTTGDSRQLPVFRMTKFKRL